FPLWLAPEQARVMPVSEKFTDYGKTIEAELKAHGFRVSGDYRPEKIGYKIREAQLEKVPYMLVVGEKEQAATVVIDGKEQPANSVSVRDRVDGDLGAMPIAELIARLEAEVREKRIRQVSTATTGLADNTVRFAEEPRGRQVDSAETDSRREMWPGAGRSCTRRVAALTARRPAHDARSAPWRPSPASLSARSCAGRADARPGTAATICGSPRR